MRVVENIQWDCEEYDDTVLPTSVKIPETLTDEEISDYLSDLTGFCHEGYVLERGEAL